MEAALLQAELSLEAREVPVGCVFVCNGKVIAGGHNMTNRCKNGIMHAEICCINQILQETRHPVSIFRSCDVYVTCEPCIMCAAALSKVGVRHVYFGCHNERFGGNGSVLRIHDSDQYGTPATYGVTSGILRHRAVDLFRRFYAQENTAAPEAKRRKKEK